MSKKLFIWNISWSVSQDELAALFSNYQSVEEVILVKDNMTWRSKWFWFVTFSDENEANDAIKTLNGHDLSWRQIAVNEAQPKAPREWWFRPWWWAWRPWWWFNRWRSSWWFRDNKPSYNR